MRQLLIQSTDFGSQLFFYSLDIKVILELIVECFVKRFSLLRILKFLT